MENFVSCPEEKEELEIAAQLGNTKGKLNKTDR